MFKTGLVHVYYGDGQGKTCAVVGLAVRACGCGCKVLFAQFLKNGSSGELNALSKLAQNIELLECKPCQKFIFNMNEQEKAQAARDQHDLFLGVQEKIQSGIYDLLVLDEAIDAVNMQMIGREEFISFIQNKPTQLEVALTGHAVFPELLGLADYVSEIKKIKHPFDTGVGARRGADW